MIELEKTYLAKFIPKDLRNCKKREIIDTYIPKSKAHPTLRIRKDGNKFEITKKEPIDSSDSSVQKEDMIPLSAAEFESLSKINGKKSSKTRHYYPFKNKIAEIDVFHGKLEGLVLVDFEFKTKEEKQSFEKPDFCLVDVTQEEFIAGGMLCGKTYKDIEKRLESFGYNKLTLKR